MPKRFVKFDMVAKVNNHKSGKYNHASLGQAKAASVDLPCQEEIMAGWPTDEEPFLSIACVTYKHRKYIEDALAGFLVQKTDFSFEIVIHDDASPDGTADILQEYQEKYPNLIRLIIQKENQYSKGKKPFFFIYPELRGKYIAFCDGDDYWTDPYKLQKQVDYLEKNPSFVISGHDACVINESGEVTTDSKLRKLRVKKHEYSARELQEGRGFVLTLSWVFRRVLANDEGWPERSLSINDDTFLISLLGQHGAAHNHDDISPGVYRVHGDGVWSMKDRKYCEQGQFLTFFMISNYYQRTGLLKLADVWRSKAYRIMLTRQFSTGTLLKESLTRLTFAREILIKLRQVKSQLKVINNDSQ
jgi:glycosyltransferase involved in cell wall biosynthesis